MKKAFQIKIIDGVKVPVPFCEEAVKALDDFHVNQVITIDKIAGTTKVRSLTENNLYFKACKVFRDMMMPDPRFMYASVDSYFRHYCQYFDHKKTIVLPTGAVHMQVKPLNFAGCKEADANGYYNDAFNGMAVDFLGVDKDTFVEEVKNRCGVLKTK